MRLLGINDNRKVNAPMPAQALALTRAAGLLRHGMRVPHIERTGDTGSHMVGRPVHAAELRVSGSACGVVGNSALSCYQGTTLVPVEMNHHY